jgi:hypothetical protein
MNLAYFLVAWTGGGFNVTVKKVNWLGNEIIVGDRRLARQKKQKLRRDDSFVQACFQKWMRWLTSTLCARPLYRRSIWQKESPTLRPMRWPYPGLGCSCRVRSCRRRFDAVPLSLLGLACLISLAPGAVAIPWQRHRKNPVGGDASANAATSESNTRIRIYSCRPQKGRYADLRLN